MVLAGLSSGRTEAANIIETVAEKILAALKQAYRPGDTVHRSSASIGATLFIGDLASVDELMKQANLAMYKAKEAGRNTLRFFDPEMQASVTARAALEADLRLGLREQQFELYYQAQSMGLSVIAEGVETEGQRDFLASQGCHACQGFLFSRPLPLEAFEKFVKGDA